MDEKAFFRDIEVNQRLMCDGLIEKDDVFVMVVVAVLGVGTLGGKIVGNEYYHMSSEFRDQNIKCEVLLYMHCTVRNYIYCTCTA